MLISDGLGSVDSFFCTNSGQEMVQMVMKISTEPDKWVFVFDVSPSGTWGHIIQKIQEVYKKHHIMSDIG